MGIHIYAYDQAFTMLWALLWANERMRGPMVGFRRATCFHNRPSSVIIFVMPFISRDTDSKTK